MVAEPRRGRAALEQDGQGQQQVPQLWPGQTEREADYMGVPGRKGHRERTHGSSH